MLGFSIGAYKCYIMLLFLADFINIENLIVSFHLFYLLSFLLNFIILRT